MARNRKQQDSDTERAGEEIVAEQADGGTIERAYTGDRQSDVIGGSDLGPDPGTGGVTPRGGEVF